MGVWDESVFMGWAWPCRINGRWARGLLPKRNAPSPAQKFTRATYGRGRRREIVGASLLCIPDERQRKKERKKNKSAWSIHWNEKSFVFVTCNGLPRNYNVLFPKQKMGTMTSGKCTPNRARGKKSFEIRIVAYPAHGMWETRGGKGGPPEIRISRSFFPHLRWRRFIFEATPPFTYF